MATTKVPLTDYQRPSAGRKQTPIRPAGGTPDNVGNFARGTNLTIGPGRGIEGGIPYGQQLQTERDEVERRYKFVPGAAARLRSATRQALGRA